MTAQKGSVGVIFLIILTLAITGIVIFIVKNLTASLPGDLIYPIKGVIETLQVSRYELEYTDRASAYLDIAQARLIEIEELAKKGNSDKEIIDTSKKLLEIQPKAISNLVRAKSQYGKNLSPAIAKLESILKQEQNELPNFLYNVSPPASEALKKIIDQSYIDSDALNSMR